MKKILEYLNLSSSLMEIAWKIFTLAVIAGGGTTAAVLAAGSELLRGAGFLAWFAIGIVAALLFAVILYLVAAASRARANATLLASLAARPSQVNPLLGYFEDLVIPVESLRLPGVSTHDHKTFRRCKFVGPGALALIGGTYLHSHFNNSGHLLVLPNDVLLTGITALRGCTVENCEFLSVTLLLPQQMAETFAESVPGLEVAKYQLLDRGDASQETPSK